MKRIHLSTSEYLSKDVTYLLGMAADYLFKPCGLWYGMDDEWKVWCDKNNPPEEFTGYKYRHELDVDLSKMCVLDDLEIAMDFYGKYRFHVDKGNFNAIDWKKVMADYTGMEIPDVAGLNWEYSMRGIIWLRNWDVNGGCIWDLSAVEWRTSVRIK